MSIKKKLIRLMAPLRRIGLRNRDFSILSNNCWGGVMSRDWGLPYNSPTCGVFLFAKDYLKFLSDLPRYLSAELEPMTYAESPWVEELHNRYPDEEVLLARLVDLTVVCVHYHSIEEARDKWARRAARINFDNLIVKFNDQNLFEKEDFDTFMKLPYEHKLFFTANPAFRGQEGVVFFDEYEKDGFVLDDIKTSRRYFNLKKYLNRISDARK